MTTQAIKATAESLATMLTWFETDSNDQLIPYALRPSVALRVLAKEENIEISDQDFDAIVNMIEW